MGILASASNTQKIFESKQKAADFYGVSVETITNAINNCTPIYFQNKDWYVDETL